MTVTRIERHVRAPRSAVYRALLDRDAVRQWMVPEGMRSEVHAFEPREGGSIRISLTYDAPTGAGKTTAHIDTYHGRFLRLVPDEQVVQSMEFETENPAMQGEMSRGQRAGLDDVARQARRPRRGCRRSLSWPCSSRRVTYFAALISSRYSLRI